MRKTMESFLKKYLKSFRPDKVTACQFQADYLLLIGKLLKNGFSLNQAMRCLMILNQDEPIFKTIYQDLEAGFMLSTALRHLRLPPVVQNQLVISQVNGGLQQTVLQCGGVLKTKAAQQAKLKELLAYPIFIVSFLVLIVIGIKLYLLPQLDNTGQLENLDHYLAIGFVLISLLMMSLIGFIFYLKRQSEYQRAQILIKLPLVNKSYLNFYQFSILQGWGMQFSNGFDLRKMCLNNQNFSEGSIQNVLSKKILDSLTSGRSLQKQIEKEPLLPNELNLIFSIGSGVNDSASDLLLMSELKYQATQASLKKLLNLVQPILFGVIALIILSAYLMILLPIYGMMKGMN
ncbi:type II secretion system F family protein [Companilactobacillus sp.]|uniref:type II secretion system F family protein n=1 Tax=Companilactobacillus sp. TaxID=2767905 RepID=UPI0025C1002F|nr:type II secretion system F family protein [Companilactobacillus sp.]MCH4008740.1 type II secretion system F family protein [Companilactobacillus sp.]MCH4051081.1 type II secretion system F family protein [Companilactobacillus sp.]MCH4076683.1 type II secretion system F family protein [Companilactobacillus sp.]MCH4125258.1 type II secretion system F family protein [Companilactobacillus sp.]MCH4131798.1 type II secretion system F family protein [Companilactobacillus sp.]